MRLKRVYFTTAAAAMLMDIGIPAVTHNCRTFWKGKGVKKEGRDWLIPAELITQRRKPGQPKKEIQK